MLTMKNVRSEENRIFADVYPENWGFSAVVSVNKFNLDDFSIELIKNEKAQNYISAYTSKAINRLRKIISGDEKMRNEMKIVWY